MGDNAWMFTNRDYPSVPFNDLLNITLLLFPLSSPWSFIHSCNLLINYGEYDIYKQLRTVLYAKEFEQKKLKYFPQQSIKVHEFTIELILA